MSREKNEAPYFGFGRQIKHLRERAKESTAEVAGAVEVDTKVIHSLERGITQPSEDMVLLLISHFGVKEHEASQIWKLAGYDQSRIGQAQDANYVEEQLNGATDLADNPIIYTDIVQVNANKYGVVINFLQSLPGMRRPMAVSRVGMSREHAKSMLEVIQNTLSAIEDTSDQPVKRAKKTKNQEK